MIRIRYRPKPGSLLTVYYDNSTAAVWEIVDYLSGDRVNVRLVTGSKNFMRRANKHHPGAVQPGFTIAISSLNLEPPNEMLVLALAADQ